MTEIDLTKEEALKLMHAHFVVQAAQADWQEMLSRLVAKYQIADLGAYSIDVKRGTLIEKNGDMTKEPRLG